MGSPWWRPNTQLSGLPPFSLSRLAARRTICLKACQKALKGICQFSGVSHRQLYFGLAFPDVLSILLTVNDIPSDRSWSHGSGGFYDSLTTSRDVSASSQGAHPWVHHSLRAKLETADTDQPAADASARTGVHCNRLIPAIQHHV